MLKANITMAVITEKLITFVICSYNHENFILECLNSVRNVDIPKDIVVIDDHSVDNTIDILKQEFINKNDFLLIVKERNYGLSHTKNLALREYIKTKYFKFIASDDYIEPKAFKNALLKLESTGADVLLCGVCEFNETGITNLYNPKLDKSPNIINFLNEKYSFHVNGAIIKLNAHFRIGFYPEHIQVEDIYFYIKAFKYLNIKSYDEVIYFHRSHENNLSRKVNVLDINLLLNEFKDWKEYKFIVRHQNLHLFLRHALDNKILAVKNAYKAKRYFYKRIFMKAFILLLIPKSIYHWLCKINIINQE